MPINTSGASTFGFALKGDEDGSLDQVITAIKTEDGATPADSSEITNMIDVVDNMINTFS